MVTNSPIKNVFTNPKFLALETSFLIILPLILMKFLPGLLTYRLWVLMLGLVYVTYVCLAQKITLERMGITLKNFWKASRGVLLPTFIFLSFMFLAIPTGLAAKYFFIQELFDEIKKSPLSYSFLVNAIFSATLQEIIFRGFYISRLEIVSKNRLFLIVWSAVVFAMIHTPFQNKFFTLFTLVLGFIYADNFLRYRNIFAIIISHAILLAGVVVQAIYF